MLVIKMTNHTCAKHGDYRDVCLAAALVGWIERDPVSIWNTHTHTHPFNGPLSRTTRVSLSQYQKGKTHLDFTEARDSEWQRHQLGHMQVCTLLQTDDHASTPPLSFLQAGCPSCRPTNSVKALKAQVSVWNMAIKLVHMSVLVVVCPVFVSIGTCITLRLGVWPDVFFYECFAAMFIYYAAHWQTYCSGSLHFVKYVLVSVLESRSCNSWSYSFLGN